MTGWAKAWLAWLTATALSFAVLEAKAFGIPGATLSEVLRTIFGFDGTGPAPRARQSIFIATWAWFGLHIWRKTAGCVSRITPPISSM